VERSDDVGYEGSGQGPSDEEATNGRTDHGETGSRVAAVLNAAEEAAETIRAEARRHADEALRQAKAEAAVRVEELTREAQRMRAEADDYARDIRVAVDSYGTQARREAEQEARNVLSDAENQARATREAAQEMANQIEEGARRQHESLVREAKSLEERRQRVLDSLRDLAAQLRGEETPISAHAIEPAVAPTLGMLAANGPRAEAAPGEYALVVEAVHEGYLLHYGEPRLLAGHDPDLALLAGDYLYALGLARLAALGDGRAVAILSELIGHCARLHAEGDPGEIPGLWEQAAREIAGPAQLS